jgi:hypothetical protein
MANNMTKYAHEVLALVDKAATKKEKIEILQSNDSMVLKNILIGTFDDAVEWLLPDTVPPYTPCDARSAPSSLHKQLDNFAYFVKGGKGPDMLKIKREMMFIRMLESIHPEDAKIVVAMLTRKLPTKGLTKALVKEAFPKLLRK